ncbi:adenylate kinase [Candidatus Riesia sp. GBBU]|nr:adenylate kinase [Candidatus Riesia sp. GBBU]
MNIILFGAPGSGKGTQAKFIMNRYGVQRISVGDILREYSNIPTILGKKIKKTMDQGKLITDKIVISSIRKKINQKSCRNGFLFDGFPRTILQAKSMKKENIFIDYAIELDVCEDLIYERILGRRVHISSNRIYHIKYSPPKIRGKDDITGEKLVVRKDDTENIIRTRLMEYKKFTKPLSKFYQMEEKNGNSKYFRINANLSIDQVRFLIKGILD